MMTAPMLAATRYQYPRACDGTWVRPWTSAAGSTGARSATHSNTRSRSTSADRDAFDAAIRSGPHHREQECGGERQAPRPGDDKQLAHAGDTRELGNDRTHRRHGQTGHRHPG